MSDALICLDTPAPTQLVDIGGQWDARVDRALQFLMGEPMVARDALPTVSQERAWALLGWVESCANRLASGGPARLLRLGVYALHLLAASERLDRRELLVVAALLKRAAMHRGLDHDEVFGQPPLPWSDFGFTAALVATASELPPTHVESLTGSGLRFSRHTNDVDVELLRRRLGLDQGE